MSLTRGQEARAWVNFNGTGTVAINDSFNVSSITDNGTGDYTVNFDQDLANANYAVTYAAVRSSDAGTGGYVIYGGNSGSTLATVKSVSSFELKTQDSAYTPGDVGNCSLVFFGDPS